MQPTCNLCTCTPQANLLQSAVQILQLDVVKNLTTHANFGLRLSKFGVRQCLKS